MLIHSQTQNTRLVLWCRPANILIFLLVGSPHHDISIRSTQACTLQAMTIIPAKLTDQILIFLSYAYKNNTSQLHSIGHRYNL